MDEYGFPDGFPIYIDDPVIAEALIEARKQTIHNLAGETERMILAGGGAVGSVKTGWLRGNLRRILKWRTE